MKITWLGAIGMSLLVSTLFAGSGLYLFQDRLTLKPVVVTTETIPGCSPIQTSMVKVIHLPQMSIPPGTFRSINDVNNLWTNCGYVIPKNSFVYFDYVVPQHASIAGLLDQQPSEMRLITIPVDLSVSIGGRLHSGDRIDLWFVSHPQKPSGSFVGKLFEHIEVISLQNANGVEIGKKETSSAKQGILSFPASVSSLPSQVYLSIRLNEKDISYALLAEQEGKLLPVARGAAPRLGSDVPSDAKAWLKTKMEGIAP